MSVFDEREKAFEAKYRLDQDVLFRVRMRRDKLFGLWAAERMGLAGDAALAYAMTVVEAEIEYPEHDVAHKVINDFALRGISFNEADIHHQMVHFMDIAHGQITEELSRG